MKQQNIARLWMLWVEDKIYQKGQQVDIPKAETGKLWEEKRGCVLSLFSAICGWPLTMLLANGPLLWLQSLLVFLFSDRYPGPDPWIPVLAQQKTLSTVRDWWIRTSTMHFLFRLPVCLTVVGICWSPEMIWNLVHPVCELVSLSSKLQNFPWKMGNRGWMAFWERELT